MPGSYKQIFHQRIAVAVWAHPARPTTRPCQADSCVAGGAGSAGRPRAPGPGSGSPGPDSWARQGQQRRHQAWALTQPSRRGAGSQGPAGWSPWWWWPRAGGRAGGWEGGQALLGGPPCWTLLALHLGCLAPLAVCSRLCVLRAQGRRAQGAFKGLTPATWPWRWYAPRACPAMCAFPC